MASARIRSYVKPDAQTGQSTDITPFWMLGGAGAEIAVDCETGRIEVTKLVNVADVGRAINPASVERQLTGAAIMQLGFTLFEEMVFSDGQVVNASLADYKIPGMLDIPHDLQAAFVEVLTATDRSAQGSGRNGHLQPCPSDCERSMRRRRRHNIRYAPHARARIARDSRDRTQTAGERPMGVTGPRTVAFTLNGRAVRAMASPHETVIEVLQRDFGLFGARELRTRAVWLLHGARERHRSFELPLPCRVRRRNRSDHDEGLSRGADLHPIQRAFVEKTGFPVRLLHAGVHLDDERAPRALRAPHRKADSTLSLRKSLSLRRIPGHHRGGQTRRRSDAGSNLHRSRATETQRRREFRHA